MTDSQAGIHLLHVEDDPDFAEMVALMLKQVDDGIDVVSVNNPTEVLSRDDLGEFDCMVSDYEMPRMNGIDVLRAIREKCPAIPFFLFTGRGSEEIASEAISAGVTDYLQKVGGVDQYELLANRIRNAVEKYRAEQQSEMNKQRLQEIADNSNDILWMFTSDWSELLFLNAAYEEIFGGSKAEVFENPASFLEKIHPDDRDRARRAMQQLSNGQPIDIEYRVNPDEEYGRWIWGKGEPVFDNEGNVVRVVGFVRDITDRKEREQEVDALHTRLEEADALINHELPNLLRDAADGLKRAREEPTPNRFEEVEIAHQQMSTLLDSVRTEEPPVLTLGGNNSRGSN